MHRGGTALAGLAAALAIGLAGSSSAGAPTSADWRAAPAPPPGAIATNGFIDDMARIGDRVYVRGSFDRIGPYVGPGIGIDPTSGGRLPSIPAANGQISDVIDDGAGGWYIAGDFDEIGGIARVGLAHLQPSGALDPNFAPELDGLATSLARNGNTLYVGGLFSRVNDQFRRGLAAIDATTGSLLGFDARLSRDVTELAFAPATDARPARLYAGARQVLALDPETGQPVSGFTSTIESDIRALAVTDDHLYVGGNGLESLDPDTGARQPAFDPLPKDLSGKPAFTGTVHILLLDGARLLAGGDFNSLGGVPGPLVALDPESGAGDQAFRPQVGGLSGSGSDRGVFDVVRFGDLLWAGGRFESVEGAAATNLVALDATSGVRHPIDPPSLNGQVNALSLGGGTLFAGGQFYLADAFESEGFAALDAETLEIDEGFAPRDSYRGQMTVGAGRIFVAPTHFSGYTSRELNGGGPFYFRDTDHIAAIDPNTGDEVEPYGVRRVEDLSGITVDGDELFIVKRLERRVRFPENRVSVHSTDDGKLLRRFRLPLPGYVANLDAVGGSLYAAGSFRRFRANGRPAHLALMKLDPRDGDLDSGFDPHADGPIYDVALVPGTVFYSGLFERVVGLSDAGTRRLARDGLASADAASGTPFPRFAPPDNAHGTNDTRLSPLPEEIFSHDVLRPDRFLDQRTGAIHRGSAGAFTRLVDHAVATPDGFVYSATLSLPIQGLREASVTFVSSVGTD